MTTGTVKFYSIEKGYGFIQPEDKSNNDVFVHVSALEKAGFSLLSEGQKVSYDLETSKGKTSAINIQVLN